MKTHTLIHNQTFSKPFSCHVDSISAARFLILSFHLNSHCGSYQLTFVVDTMDFLNVCPLCGFGINEKAFSLFEIRCFLHKNSSGSLAHLPLPQWATWLHKNSMPGVLNFSNNYVSRWSKLWSVSLTCSVNIFYEILFWNFYILCKRNCHKMLNWAFTTNQSNGVKKHINKR